MSLIIRSSEWYRASPNPNFLAFRQILEFHFEQSTVTIDVMEIQNADENRSLGLTIVIQI